MKKIILIVLTTFLSTTSYAGFTVNDLENGCKNYGPRGSSVTPNISGNKRGDPSNGGGMAKCWTKWFLVEQQPYGIRYMCKYERYLTDLNSIFDTQQKIQESTTYCPK